MIMMDKGSACQDEVMDNLVLQKDYIEQLKENRHFHKDLAGMERSTTTQFEMTEALLEKVYQSTERNART